MVGLPYCASCFCCCSSPPPPPPPPPLPGPACDCSCCRLAARMASRSSSAMVVWCGVVYRQRFETITCYSGTRVKFNIILPGPSAATRCPAFVKSITCGSGMEREDGDEQNQAQGGIISISHTAKSILRHPFALASGYIPRWRASSHVMPRDGHGDVVILASCIDGTPRHRHDR
jgi:hypothetical protein